MDLRPEYIKHGESIVELREKHADQQKHIDSMEEFLWGNGQPGFVSQIGARTKRIELIAVVILTVVIARSGGDIGKAIEWFLGK